MFDQLKYNLLAGILLLLFSTSVSAQLLSGDRQAEDILFQGLERPNEIGVRGLAMGGAYTSVNGDLSSLYWNPAGIANLSTLQISVSGQGSNRFWMEHQRWYYLEYGAGLPLILDGIYTPKVENNGIPSDEIVYDINDFKEEPTGVDPHKKEFADWKHTEQQIGLNSIAMAYPVRFQNRQLVFAAAYHNEYNLDDFDRNETVIRPHYGWANVYSTSSENHDWYIFNRNRNGNLYTLNGTIAYQHNDIIQIGVSGEFTSGKIDEEQSYNKVGYFQNFDNRYIFSYDTLNTFSQGTSAFSSAKFSLGFILSFDRINLGFNMTPGYTIKRSWTHEFGSERADGGELTGFTSSTSNVDKLELPAELNFGISVRPSERMIVAFDVDFMPYSKSKIKFGQPDSSYFIDFFHLEPDDSTQHLRRQNWFDKTTIKFGTQIGVTKGISLLAGYRIIPQIFNGIGEPFQEKGTKSESYTVGTSIKLLNFGTLDIAYEYWRLEYADIFVTNTNHHTNDLSRFLVGYTLGL